jgi:hypothetical protein
LITKAHAFGAIRATLPRTNMRNIAAFVILLAVPVLAQQSAPSGPLTNQRVIQLVQAGLSQDDILRIIRTAPSVSFSFAPAFTSQLMQYGVSEETIKAMAARQIAPNPDTKAVQARPGAMPATKQDLRAEPEPMPTPKLQPQPELLRTQATPERPLFREAAPTAPGNVPRNFRMFISPMQGNLDGFIAAEVIKQHVPILVVTDERDAQFVLTGLSLHEDDRWYHIAFGTFKDRNEGNVRLLNMQSGTMAWAGEAGDRSLIYGGLRRGGQRKIAQRIVDHMRKDLFAGTK